MHTKLHRRDHCYSNKYLTQQYLRNKRFRGIKLKEKVDIRRYGRYQLLSDGNVVIVVLSWGTRKKRVKNSSAHARADADDTAEDFTLWFITTFSDNLTRLAIICIRSRPCSNTTFRMVRSYDSSR
ncbi:unnamed protein product [Albugo candida]|uniref:Uncharacterized protein n=1 Tax=Albugo candida TaxID=65357 RepID=A0A024G761_9STRA|nr:unnamed protein product [Albugo candida]|eukprot:CCI42716.1 unnamed protein product [Albugo candida]